MVTSPAAHVSAELVVSRAEAAAVEVEAVTVQVVELAVLVVLHAGHLTAGTEALQWDPCSLGLS